MDSNLHTLRAFDREQEQLRARVVRMGERTGQALRNALQCLISHDLDGAARIVVGDHEIDEMASESEQQALKLIALRAPVADDLREVVAALKIVAVLERAADHAKNIAKRVPLIEQPNEFPPIAMLPDLAKDAEELLRDAILAFVERDAAKASAVCASDRVVDDHYAAVSRALLSDLAENPSSGATATHLLFIAKSIERIGDYATNIAEMVYFAAVGTRIGERVRGADPFAAA